MATEKDRFIKVVDAVRAVGGDVSSKVVQQLSPRFSGDVLGMVATSTIEPSEMVTRVPPGAQLTLETVHCLGGRLVAEVVVRIGSKGVQHLEVLAFVAQRLANSRAAGQAIWDDNRGAANPNEEALRLLDMAWATQALADWNHMPQMKLVKEEWARLVLSPSHEVSKMLSDDETHRDAFTAVTEILTRAGVEWLPDYETFVQAYLVLLSRTFIKPLAEGGSQPCYVLVGELFNHAPVPNAEWSFDEHGNFVVIANSRVEAGEEICVTYGRQKSSARLFHTYGFTLDPEYEPTWSCRIWPTQVEEILASFLPTWPQGRAFELESGDVDEGTRQALHACAKGGERPKHFLRTLCLYCLRQYQNDALLQPALCALGRARVENPTSARWWKHGLEEAEAPFHNSARSRMAVDTGFAQSALRVKMSEYLCLTSHLEALDLLDGKVAAGECLENVPVLMSVLHKTLEECPVQRAHSSSGRRNASASKLRSRPLSSSRTRA